MDYKIEHFEKHGDHRGQLIVFLKNSDLKSNLKNFGQIYFVTFEKEQFIRGNHYHKKWREWFGVVFGKFEVVLKDVNSGEIKKLILTDDTDKYVRLEVGPYVAHTFKNLSPKAALLNYANAEWSAEDVFYLKLME